MWPLDGLGPLVPPSVHRHAAGPGPQSSPGKLGQQWMVAGWFCDPWAGFLGGPDFSALQSHSQVPPLASRIYPASDQVTSPRDVRGARG